MLATEWEIARFAASLVRVNYKEKRHATDIFANRKRAFGSRGPRSRAATPKKAYAAAAVRHEAEYFVPIEHHNPMELYAATAIWNGGGKLTVYDKTQGVQNVQRYLHGVCKMKPEDLRVMSPYIGGAFGSGLRPQYQGVLAVLGARALERSVRLVLTRQQMYGLGHRPATIERLALGANCGGTLDAISHEAIAETSQYEDFFRNDTTWSGLLYTCANTNYEHKLVRLDLPTSCDMRAPGAATGVYALECAMDELAVALAVDPMELRLRCYSERDQNNDIPYTSKALRECYREGSQTFGWEKRNPEPRSMRDGTDLVGWGMATGVWDALRMPFDARITLTANGHAEIACATSDIGTGTYTIMAQVAADKLGLPLDNVTVKLGDSSLPLAPVEGGSWTAASVSQAITNAADEIRKELLRLAKTMPHSPLASARPGDVDLIDGKIVSRADPRRAVSIADAMRHGGATRIVRKRGSDFKDDREGHKHARNTHSAIFAEVKVDEELGVVRVTRVVSAVAAGRIINTKTAHSQIMGGVVWGIGMALHEESVDRRRLRPGHERELRRVPRAGERRRARHRGDLRRRARRARQSARHQGRRRDRHRRRRGGDRQRDLSRHRQAGARPADHARQAFGVTPSPALRGRGTRRFGRSHSPWHVETRGPLPDPPPQVREREDAVPSARASPPSSGTKIDVSYSLRRVRQASPSARRRRRRCPWRRPRRCPAGRSSCFQNGARVLR